ncbi:MAG TPA: hypothetical protein VN231_00310 [Allosphingosinicella sp.]|nr:hypothetical protein [Allosphingosinicella sp.]
MRAALVGLAVAATALAACGSEPVAEPERPVRRPPQPACDQANEALAARSGSGEFLFERSGAAMIGAEDWLRLGRAEQDRLIETLAVVAACSAATPQREVEVTVRSESGMILSSRRVRPSTDFRSGGN